VTVRERFDYHFAWNAAKAAGNVRKHGIDFELAATVFRDPLAGSRYDEDHGEQEERWVTLGQAETGALLVVVHMFEELNEHEVRVRLISARPATAHERRQYETST